MKHYYFSSGDGWKGNTWNNIEDLHNDVTVVDVDTSQHSLSPELPEMTIKAEGSDSEAGNDSYADQCAFIEEYDSLDPTG